MSNKYNKQGSMLDRPKVCHVGPKPNPGSPPAQPFEGFLQPQVQPLFPGITIRWGAYACYHPTPGVAITSTTWFGASGNWPNNDQLINCVQGPDVDWEAPATAGTYKPAFEVTYADGNIFRVEGIVTLENPH